MLNLFGKILARAHRLERSVQMPKLISTSVVSRFEPIDMREARKRRRKKEADTQQSGLVRQGHVFDNVPLELKNKATFEEAISLFKKKTINARGHVDFIFAALKRMKEFNVHEDLEVYKKLIDLFPKGRMKTTNTIQAEFAYYPRHQDCCITIIEQFTFFRLSPDKEIYKMVEAVFGNESQAMVRMKSALYWMPKWRHADPYAPRQPLPSSELELARLLLQRLCRDPATRTRLHFSESIPGAKEDTWVVSGQSPLQQHHIDKLAEKQPVYIDGPFRAWLDKKHLNYFMLSADPDRRKLFGDLRPENHNWHTPEEWERMDNKYTTEFPESRKQLMLTPTIHEQPEGTILALAITGSGSKESLAYWLTFLEQENPRLAHTPVVFRIASSTGAELEPIQGARRFKATANLQETDSPV